MHPRAEIILTYNILITGATGFVGGNIVKSLRNKDIKLTVIQRGQKKISIDGYKKNINRIVTDDLFEENTHWWLNVLKEIDCVIHSAWFVKPPNYLESNLNHKCLEGSITMAEAIVKSEVKKVVGIGTCFEYDLSFGLLSIDTPLLPHTLYGKAKVELFKKMNELFSANDIGFAWCRLFYVYGEGEHKNRLFPTLIDGIKQGKKIQLTNGNQIRDFISIDTASRWIADVALSDDEGAINICSGVPVTVRQFSEQILGIYGGNKSLLEFGTKKRDAFDPPIVLGDISKNNFL